MSNPETITQSLSRRPLRADAQRNYDKLLEAAREAFAEDGSAATLDDIAHRAGVGIGTLYRHFPTRQHLLEAVYIDEVQAMAQSAADLAALPPWEALDTWLHQYVRYAATKRALAEELLAYIDTDAEVFQACRAAVVGAGDMLLERAQKAGVVRPDTNFGDVGRIVAGLAAIRGTEPEQIERMLDIVLDGLRYSPR
jgi:AcrR family transcriptional regulator